MTGPGVGADALTAAVTAALAARERLARRPLGDTIAALAAAARQWAADAELPPALATSGGSSPAMARAVVPIAAEALDADVMTALVEAEWGAGAARRPAPTGPRLIAHVVASNVPALALPAIALSCLAGAAVVVKSGRADPHSAPAFRAAVAAVDPALAATIVAAYWPGGAVEPEAAALARADLVVATGGDAAVAGLTARARAPVVAHGPRTTVAILGADAEAQAEAMALDVALHDQRGCLSPHAVYVPAAVAGRFAARLAAALVAVAEALPPAAADAAARARVAIARAEAEWEGATLLPAGRSGAVLLMAGAGFEPPIGGRTVRVHPLDDAAAFPGLVRPGTVECVGTAHPLPPDLVEALCRRGVSRIAAPGRLQRPRLSWPRGQRAPLGVLVGRAHPPLLEVEA